MQMKRRDVIAASAGIAGSLVTGVARAAIPCPPSPVTVAGGGTATTPCVAPGTSYSTTFSVDQNPLSEGGRWLHTDPTLTYCKAVGGRAFGTQTGSGTYDDSNAYLAGFGVNHEVEGTIWLNPSLSGSGNREVEILLHWTDNNPLRNTAYGATHANGYEVNVQHAGNYMQLGRFKGALLYQVNSYATPRTGDRFRARIEGQRIRVWWNDVLKIDYTDNDTSLRITAGNPGIGFYVNPSVGNNTDFGFDSVTVRAL
jgi:hypothetical protein